MSVTESVIVTETDVEDAEQTEKTLERAEQLRNEREQNEERPDWLPEEFDSVEDFLNDYNRLREGSSEEDTSEEEDQSDEVEEDENTEEEESSQDESEGVDFDYLTEEFLENGTLSDESFAALEEAGIPRDVVEAHIAGLQAQAELTRYKAAETVGGAENLDAILQWAGQALPEKDIDRINGLVAAGDFDGYLLALQGVKARYEAAFGSVEGSQLGGEVSALGTDVYQSMEEMKSDMRDPRYGKDEAFRARVAAKVARSRRGGYL